jgi:hypothetical protein
MDKKHIITFLKQMKYTISAIIILITFVLSCTNPKNSKKSTIKLVKKTAIEEKGNNVLHHIPLSVQFLGDSLLCIKLNATRFNIYNYYTGSIVKSIELDSNILPKLLSQACANSSRKYRLMSMQEYKEIGIPALTVENAFYKKQEQQLYLFFTASFSIDTFIMIKGVKEPAIASQPLCYVTTLDQNYINSNKYTLLEFSNIGPAFLYGGLMLKDKLVVPNIELEHIGKSGFGMLCAIGLGQECGTVKSIAMPFDKRSIEQRKRHILEKVSFADIDGQSYYVSDGKRIVHCTDSIFTILYSMDDNEHVYNLYYNHTDKQLYINTRFGDQSDLKGSKIFALNISDKKIKLVDSNSKINSIDFVNDSTILSISENDATRAYEFLLYKY